MTTTLEREFHCFKCIKRMRLYGMIALILLLIVLGGVYWFANAGNFL